MEVFLAMTTQWHVSAGLAGGRRTGLIYSEASNWMREHGLKRARRAEILEDLHAMELAALAAWAERNG